MTAETFQALLPWLVVGGGAVVTLLLTSAARLHGAVAGIAAATLAIAALTLGRASAAPAAAALPLLVVDGFTAYFAGLVLARLDRRGRGSRTATSRATPSNAKSSTPRSCSPPWAR